MKRRKLFRQHLIIATFALSLLITALAPAQPVEAAAKKAAQVKTVTVKNVSTTKAKISWKKAKNAKSYQVSIATDKKFKKGKKTYNTKALSKNISKLKAGKKYYVRVRAKAKKWGKWSSVKTFKLPVAKKAAKKPAATKKPANNSGGNSNSNPMYTPEKTKPATPAGCQHEWETKLNPSSTTKVQKYLTQCDKTKYSEKERDLNELIADMRMGRKPSSFTKTINGKTVIYKISEWNDWGVQYYDGEYHEIYDIPCPVCHGFHDPIKIESITEITADEISNTYIKECKKCGAKEPIKSTVTYK